LEKPPVDVQGELLKPAIVHFLLNRGVLDRDSRLHLLACVLSWMTEHGIRDYQSLQTSALAILRLLLARDPAEWKRLLQGTTDPESIWRLAACNSAAVTRLLVEHGLPLVNPAPRYYTP
jgi:hypothetical protein